MDVPSVIRNRSTLWAGALLSAVAMGATGAGAEASQLLIELRGHGSLDNTGTLEGEASFEGGAAFGEGLAGANAGFDNSGRGAIALPDADDGLAGLQSLTFSVFLKMEDPDVLLDDGTSYLFSDQNDIAVRGNGGRVRLSLNDSEEGQFWNSSGHPANSGSYDNNMDDGWVFVAVTADGENRTFWYGLESTGELVAENAGDAQINELLGNHGADLLFGSENLNMDGTYAGLMDNIRLHGSYTDASGALSESQLDDIFQAGLAEIPEPGSAALVAGLGGLLLMRRRISAA